VADASRLQQDLQKALSDLEKSKKELEPSDTLRGVGKRVQIQGKIM
jgi:hypothetical protein